jgi:phosphatidylserine/phosphatidylglycerophosphate/cardiolipin synthase-like enzyme
VTAFSLHHLDQFRGAPLPAGYPVHTRVLYAPVDDVHGALAAVVGATKASLAIAMFALSDRPLADAVKGLCANPAVQVRITLDASQAITSWETALLAAESYPATDIAVGTSEKHNLMHLKLAVMDGRFTVHGSTNWTISGERTEDNAIVVIDNRAISVEATARLDAIHAWMLAHPVTAAEAAALRSEPA